MHPFIAHYWYRVWEWSIHGKPYITLGLWYIRCKCLEPCAINVLVRATSTNVFQSYIPCRDIKCLWDQFDIIATLSFQIQFPWCSFNDLVEYNFRLFNMFPHLQDKNNQTNNSFWRIEPKKGIKRTMRWR